MDPYGFGSSVGTCIDICTNTDIHAYVQTCLTLAPRDTSFEACQNKTLETYIFLRG